MSIAARVKSFGGMVFGFAMLIGLLAFGITLLSGVAAFSVWVFRWTIPVFTWALAISVVILAPLALIPRTRGYSAIGFIIASFALGAVLWLWGMAYTYSAWGMLGVIVGLFLLGVGVLPVAMLAALFDGDWGNLTMFIVTGGLMLGLRILASWLAEKADERTRAASQMTVNYP